MSCSEWADHIFIRDKYDIFWRYVLNKGFKRVKLRYQHLYSDHFTLPRVASYNSRLRHFSEHTHHAFEYFNCTTGEFTGNEDLRTKGQGSVSRGIFEGFFDVISTASQTGVRLFHVIAQGLTHVTNNIVGVVLQVRDDDMLIIHISGLIIL